MPLGAKITKEIGQAYQYQVLILAAIVTHAFPRLLYKPNGHHQQLETGFVKGHLLSILLHKMMTLLTGKVRNTFSTLLPMSTVESR
jgi:hypothetical protein